MNADRTFATIRSLSEHQKKKINDSVNAKLRK